MILAGDVGGTKTVLGLFAREGKKLILVREAACLNAEVSSFDQALKKFLASSVSAEKIGAACVGVAGPVVDGRAEMMNLSWTLDERELSRDTGIKNFKILNDLEAAAYGMLQLPEKEFDLIIPGKGERSRGNIAILAPGTGLGEALLFWDGQKYHAMASEGGHTDFGPRSDVEISLLQFLKETHSGHVSYERILSGSGILQLYQFLLRSRDLDEPTWLNAKAGPKDASERISSRALAGSDPICAAAVDLFCSILGAEAGNLALKGLARGGVILGGGIPPKILPALRKGSFGEAFVAKGRYEKWISDLSVRVALNPKAPLIGAAHFMADCLP